MFLYSILLGIVEGITEFLPISSTGHLILAEHILSIPTTEFIKSFDIFIQLGAILSVVVIYWRKVWNNKNIFWKLIAGFLPTAIIGLTVYKIIKKFFLGNSTIVLISLFVGGVIILLFEKWYKNAHTSTEKLTKLENITYIQAIKIGLFQSIAVIPGVSRSAATILGGLWLGVERQAIVDFSFMLAIPTMAAATGLDLLKSGFTFTKIEWTYLAIGFITSFITAYLAVKFLLSYIQKHDFSAFGWYRIVVAMIGFLILK